MRWAKDGLMHYADAKKAPWINEALGRQLPKLLRNPALKASAQIHSMGRSNSKALGLGKILTEKNLQGYRIDITAAISISASVNSVGRLMRHFL